MNRKIKPYLIIVLILGGLFIISTISFAHSGRTDSSGCHTCRTNCPSWGLSYGEYHCHRSKGIPQPEEPIKSHYDPSGGYTEPAPEYKEPEPEYKEPESEYKEPEPKQEEPSETIDDNQKAAVADSKSEGGSSAWIFWVLGIIVVGGIAYKIGKKK